MKSGGLVLWNAIAISEMSKTSWQMVKTLYEIRFGEPFKGPIIPFGAMVEYHPISSRDQSRLHQRGKQVLPGIFLGYALIAERIGKGNILIADLEESEKLDASEISPRRINGKAVVISQMGEEFIDFWIRLPRRKWPKSWPHIEDPVVPLERNLYGHPLAWLLWERQFEETLSELGLEKVPNWECLFCPFRNKDYSYQFSWMPL